jgi:hypothetical protein
LVKSFLNEDVGEATDSSSDEAADKDSVRGALVEAVAVRAKKEGVSENDRNWKLRLTTYLSAKTCEIAPMKRKTQPHANPMTKLRAVTMGSVKR